jgi:alpha-glucosidase
MYPEMLHDRDKPKDPVTIDVYPFGKSSFSLYEDDGVTQEYRKEASARTLIDVEAPKSLDTPNAQVTVRVGPARGKYRDMPASRSYVVEVHMPAKPAGLTLGDKALPSFEKRAEYDAAPEGWFFDVRDRRGVLHIKTRPQPLSSGFVVKVSMVS